MNLQRLLLVLLLFVSAVPPVQAQRFPFYNLSVEDGLIQSQPLALAADKKGHLWIGTLGGLSRYDGRHFVNYTAKDGLSGNMVRALAFDTIGNLWVGVVNGISRFDGKTFHNIPLPKEVKNERTAVRQIVVDGRGEVWLLVSGRLYFMQQDTARLVSLPFQNSFVTAFLPNGPTLWLTNANGMAYRYHQNRWDSLPLPVQEGRPPVVQQIFQSKDGRIWLAASNGLWLWEEGGFRAMLPPAFETYFPLFSITEDKNGTLWLGCAKGAVSLPPNGPARHYGKKNGLSDNSFYNVFCDRAGNVWLASDGQGIYRFSGAPFTILDETTGLGSGQVLSLAAGAGGEVFLGTMDAGLYRYKSGVTSAVPLQDKVQPSITALDFYQGMLWIGTRGQGLWQWDGKRVRKFNRKSNDLPSDYIACLRRDSKGILWVGTSGGLARHADGQFQNTPGKNAGEEVQDILEWSTDSILFTGAKGIWCYHQGRPSPLITNSEIDSLHVQTLARTGDLLWAGTAENGIVIYNTKLRKSLVVNTDNGLQSDFIYSMLVDRLGNVWVGTGFGIHRFSGYQTDQPQLMIFGSGQGIIGMESNHNAAIQTDDGTVWMGTTSGAVLFPTQLPRPLSQNTAIVLQSVSLPGQPDIPKNYYDSLAPWYGTPQNLVLPYRQNTVSFTYQSLALAHQGQVRYRHRLLGLERDWSVWLAENTITYSALPPGHYTLEVQSGIEGNAAPLSMLEYTFTVQTPFHKSVLFRVLLVVLLILIGIAIQYLLSRRRRRLQEMIRALRAEEQNKVRQRTAEDFHDEVGNRITRISVLTQVLKNKLNPLTDDSERILSKIQENASLLYNGTRDILWALKPENGNLYELLQRLDELGTDLFRDTPTRFYFAGAKEQWRAYRLPMDVNRNVMMIFKEAMNNCLKYAEAEKVSLIADVNEEKVLTIFLEDNGKGFPAQEESRGQGLNNMKRRASRVGGSLEVESTSGGTTIKLHLGLTGFKEMG